MRKEEKRVGERSESISHTPTLARLASSHCYRLGPQNGQNIPEHPSMRWRSVTTKNQDERVHSRLLELAAEFSCLEHFRRNRRNPVLQDFLWRFLHKHKPIAYYGNKTIIFKVTRPQLPRYDQVDPKHHSPDIFPSVRVHCAKPPFAGRPSSWCPRREGAGPPLLRGEGLVYRTMCFEGRWPGVAWPLGGWVKVAVPEAALYCH